MKTLRRICAVTILSLTLAGSALAGHMDTMGYVPPPPQPGETSSPPTTGITTTIILTIISLIH